MYYLLLVHCNNGYKKLLNVWNSSPCDTSTRQYRITDSCIQNHGQLYTESRTAVYRTWFQVSSERPRGPTLSSHVWMLHVAVPAYPPSCKGSIRPSVPAEHDWRYHISPLCVRQIQLYKLMWRRLYWTANCQHCANIRQPFMWVILITGTRLLTVSLLSQSTVQIRTCLLPLS